MFQLTLVILATLLFSLLLWKRWRFYYASFQMKGPIALPFIGNILQLGKLEEILTNLTKLKDCYGSPMRLWLGTSLLVYITEPEDLEILLNSPNALAKLSFYDFFIPLVGQSIFTCRDLSRWRRNRKLIATTLNQRILNSFIPIFEEQSLILCEKLKAKVGTGEFDAELLFHRCHLDMIYETSMGVKINAQTCESEYVEWQARLRNIAMYRIVNIWLHPDFIYKRTQLFQEQEKLVDSVNAFNKNVIRIKREEHKQSVNCDVLANNKTFLDCLLDSESFTDDELNAEISSFIVGGIDTTTVTEGFALMMLGMYQDMQERVFEEQQQIFGNTDRPIISDDLNQMVYLEQVIKETIRLFPPAPIIGRTVTGDVQLGSYLIPEGTDCLLSIFDLHRNPKIWKDPLKFDPNRFVPEEIAKRHPYSWIPFSGGPRNCVGLKYGMMSVKTLLSIVIRKYKIFCDYSSPEEIAVMPNILLNAVDGLKISVQMRD